MVTTLAFAERIFEQIKGFGSYGFPESHAASFALLCYASSWLKCHEPAIFTCALVNSWPMGFYSPDQLLQEARRQGIEVRPVDVCHSDWDCTLEPDAEGTLAIRMGLRLVRGLAEADARRAGEGAAAVARRRRPVPARRPGRTGPCPPGRWRALRALASDRHQARWQVAAVQPQLPLFADAGLAEAGAIARANRGRGPDGRLSNPRHYAWPASAGLLRARLRALGCRSSSELQGVEHGDNIAVAGLVVGRQRPQTASGVTFVTLEDEHGMVNVVVWRALAERQRRALVGSQLLKVSGRLEQENGVRHLIARRLEDESAAARAGCAQPGFSLTPNARYLRGSRGCGRAREAATALQGTGLAGVRGHAPH
jgi:error-prone DNA polymerase